MLPFPHIIKLSGFVGLVHQMLPNLYTKTTKTVSMPTNSGPRNLEILKSLNKCLESKIDISSKVIIKNWKILS